MVSMRPRTWQLVIVGLAIVLFVSVRHLHAGEARGARTPTRPPLKGGYGNNGWSSSFKPIGLNTPAPPAVHNAPATVAAAPAVVNTPPPEPPKPQVVRYVIIAGMRTGSSLLCLLLNVPEGAACSSEALLAYEETSRKNGGDQDLRRITSPEGWPLYKRFLDLTLNPFAPVPAKKGESKDDLVMRKTMEALALSGDTYRWVNGARVIGFKLKYHMLNEDAHQLFDYFEENNVHVVHLQRRCTLDAFVSQAAARKSGVWHVVDDSTPNNAVKIEAKPDEVLEYLESMEVQRDRVRAQAEKRKKLSYTEVFYEDFAGENAEHDLARLYETLGLQHDSDKVQQIITEVSTYLKPVASIQCKDRFKNWTALRNRLVKENRKEDVELCENTKHPIFGSAGSENTEEENAVVEGGTESTN